MNLLKILYNQYYLFYKRFEIFGEEPEIHARYSLLLNLIFFFHPLLSFLLTFLFCYQLSSWTSIIIPILLIVIAEIMHMRGCDKKIVEQNPSIFNSNMASRIFAILFLIISYSITFTVPIYEKEYRYSHCR